ncbi:hypothetical protein LEP1GSC130_3199 [Leptospira santarosai str. 200403458]|nr:hypothetical protein LEP1GSC130_3199 [Leptospira santarosai str. 200403458]
MIPKEPSLRSGYLASTVARCRDEIQNHFFPIQLFGTKKTKIPIFASQRTVAALRLSRFYGRSMSG